MTLTNQGAPDRWNLLLSGAGAAKGWALYRDVNANKAYDAGTDVLLTDTNADTKIDTGRVDPASSMTVLMVWDSPASTRSGPSRP